METTRVERKRAYDRQAQRANRAKNRAYITRLEETIAELTKGDHQNRLAYLSSCASEKDCEIGSLRKALAKIRTALQDVDVSKPRTDSLPAPNPLLEVPTDISVLPAAPWPVLGSGETTDPVILKTNQQDHSSANINLEQLPNAENYFKLLNFVVTKLQENVDPGSLSEASDDEDITIRGVMLGWDEAARIHHLDAVWEFLRQFDGAIRHRASTNERIVILRLTRTMLLHKIRPPHQSRPPIPNFMAPTTLQRAQAHPVLVDLFAWPGFRDYLIQNGIQSVSTNTAANFMNNFRFVWPYETRDMYLTLKSTGRYKFSDAFTHRFNRIDSYRVTPWEEIAGHLETLGLATPLEDELASSFAHSTKSMELSALRLSPLAHSNESEWARLFETDFEVFS